MLKNVDFDWLAMHFPVTATSAAQSRNNTCNCQENRSGDFCYAKHIDSVKHSMTMEADGRTEV